MSVLPHHRCVNDFRCCIATSERIRNAGNGENDGRKKTAGQLRRFSCSAARNDLNLLDGFEHFECGLVRADKQAFEVFTQTLALQRVAACALFFSSHGDLVNVNAISENVEL